MLGLDDLRGLLNPWQLCDSMIYEELGQWPFWVPSNLRFSMIMYSRDIGKENRKGFLSQVLLGRRSTETASVLSGSLYWSHKTLPAHWQHLCVTHWRKCSSINGEKIIYLSCLREEKKIHFYIHSHYCLNSALPSPHFIRSSSSICDSHAQLTFAKIKCSSPLCLPMVTKIVFNKLQLKNTNSWYISIYKAHFSIYVCRAFQFLTAEFPLCLKDSHGGRNQFSRLAEARDRMPVLHLWNVNEFCKLLQIQCIKFTPVPSNMILCR